MVFVNASCSTCTKGNNQTPVAFATFLSTGFPYAGSPSPEWHSPLPFDQLDLFHSPSPDRLLVGGFLCRSGAVRHVLFDRLVLCNFSVPRQGAKRTPGATHLPWSADDPTALKALPDCHAQQPCLHGLGRRADRGAVFFENGGIIAGNRTNPSVFSHSLESSPLSTRGPFGCLPC